MSSEKRRRRPKEPRNIPYSDKQARVCIIDFELAEVLPFPPPPEDADQPAANI